MSDNKGILSRKGYFKLQRELILEDFESAKRFFEDVIIIRAENCMITDIITYWAYSEYFDEINLNELIPEYEAILIDNREVKWKRM